jgi:hypothetical protein
MDHLDEQSGGLLRAHLTPFNRIRDAPESRRSFGEGARSVLAGHERRDLVVLRRSGFGRLAPLSDIPA